MSLFLGCLPESKLMVIDGKTSHSVEDLPADVREKYEQQMLGVCVVSAAGA